MTIQSDDYTQFLADLKAVTLGKPILIGRTLSNVFSMRMIGNKTHGDLAEIAMSEFFNRHLTGYVSKHVGKDLFRAKSCEEDVEVTNPAGRKILISIKAYGCGPLQLSTNKDASMFTLLEGQCGNKTITDKSEITKILNSTPFQEFNKINVLPLIYDEKKYLFRIMPFDVPRAFSSVTKISRVAAGSGRKHPIYLFEDAKGQYIFEVRYGTALANALQRGLWTHTMHAEPYFIPVTGWVKYEINKSLLNLIAAILVSSAEDHQKALEQFFLQK